MKLIEYWPPTYFRPEDVNGPDGLPSSGPWWGYDEKAKTFEKDVGQKALAWIHENRSIYLFASFPPTTNIMKSWATVESGKTISHTQTRDGRCHDGDIFDHEWGKEGDHPNIVAMEMASGVLLKRTHHAQGFRYAPWLTPGNCAYCANDRWGHKVEEARLDLEDALFGITDAKGRITNLRAQIDDQTDFIELHERDAVKARKRLEELGVDG